jgi:xanthine dehydrogenase accessory factor
MKDARSIFRFLVEAVQRGEQTALVTITGVIGRSSREPGTHMAVSETGAFCGSLSGGCIESAVIGEAVRIIREGRAVAVRRRLAAHRHSAALRGRA